MTGIIVFFLRILLAASLYAFLIWALYTLWRELRTSQMIVNAKKAPSLNIQILDSDNPEEHEFHKAQILIGRDPACELCLQNELVSAQHARLSFHHNQWWVEDLLSTNGTYLNEERVYTPTVLITGDEVRCGKVNLQIGFTDHQGS
jgi:hypothetical protein